MRVITETELRDKYKKSEFASYTLPEGCKLTPAAAQFLSERRIQVASGPEPARKTLPGSKAVNPVKPAKQEYRPGDFDGKKPEHMTHVRGSKLVLKNHPRIKFRGRIDTFEALLIKSIIDVEGIGYRELGRDLREILEYVRQMLRAEVKEEPLPADH